MVRKKKRLAYGRPVYILVGSLFAAPFVSGSDFGTTGLIDIPTARMQQDGVLSVGAAYDGQHQSYFATYQAFPWLEATFRYTGFEQFSYWDRNYAFKARVLEETQLLPQVAFGIQDLVGTGVFGSEYFVASKRVGSFDVTGGMAWGRLAGNGQATNPLGLLDRRFEVRPEATSDVTNAGRVRSFYLRGDVGFFAGVSYEHSDSGIKLVAEYNPDQYDFNNRGNRPEYRPSSSFSYGIEWQPADSVVLGLTHQHGDEIGISVRSSLYTKALPSRRKAPEFVSSMFLAQSDLPKGISKNSWYDRLLYDVERSGLILVEGTISGDGKDAQLVVGNASYSLWIDALSRHIALADLHLPPSVENLYLITEDGGHRSGTLVVPRPSVQALDDNTASRVRVIGGRTLRNPQNRTGFATGNVVAEVNLGTRFQLFDPDDPARYQVNLNLNSEYALNNHWSIRGTFTIDLENNFDESNRRNSNSQLPNVRTGVVKYLVDGATGIDQLVLEGRDTYGSHLHYRAFGGILEEMYSGVGGEVLFWPSKSRFAVGASLAYVKQRDFDKSFKHLDYEVLTGFVSGYWATPWYNYDVAVHVGRYLAKDIGATLDVRRTFRSGWQVGVFATLTDVPFEVFGEGSFDKGFYFQVPLDGLFGSRTRANIATRIRPVLRDGGQRLEGHSGNIFWDLRQVRLDALVIDEGLVK